MKVLNMFGIFVFAFLWASAASADIYSWTDENGVMHFTNVAPPPQARILVKDAPGDHNQGDYRAPEASVDERLKRAEERADDLAHDLDLANERAREALQKARELEERIARANAGEAQFVQEAAYRYDAVWEEEVSGSPYYGGYVYRAAPYRRPINCRPERWRSPRISHFKKARSGKHYYGYRPWEGSRNYGVIGINRAATQSHRIFNKSRSNPLTSNFISRRALY